MEADKIKHLEFIQSIITRMGSNSFQIKGWCITISSALLAIYASTKNDLFIILAVAPTIMFWFLDSYYLMQERKFRALYNDISGVSNRRLEIKPFEMRIDSYSYGEYRFCSVLCSVTIVALYLPICFVLTACYYFL